MDTEKIKNTKEDLKTPKIEKGGTAIVFQRHEKYDRNIDSETSGSLSPESAKDAYNTASEFFTKMVEDKDLVDIMILFTSSDTQYNQKGYRSIETADQAQQAAIDVLLNAGLDPNEHIINLNARFKTKRFNPTDSTTRPIRHIREPQIFDQSPEYISFLQEKYGAANEITTPEGETRRIGLTPDAFDAHESDREKEVREKLGAEGVYDILDRTKKALDIQQRYAELFHASNPGKRLVIWSASHYDTISPFIKDATETPFTEYVGVDYGAGIVISIPPKDANEDNPSFKIGERKVDLPKKSHRQLGSLPIKRTVKK